MKFTYQFDHHTPSITVELSNESALPDVLEAFEMFLIAAGFCFDGKVDIVPVFSTEEVH